MAVTIEKFHSWPHTNDHLLVVSINIVFCFQITVWDYVRYGANDFLGEVLFELSNHPLDDEPEWYILHGHQETHFHTVCSLNQFIF